MTFVILGDEPDTVRPKVTVAQPYYIVSVDLGQSIDPTAIAVLEIVTRQVVWDRWLWASPEQRASGDVTEPPKDWIGPVAENTTGLRGGWRVAHVNLRHLERLPLRVAYPDQVDYVVRLMRRPHLQPAELVVDSTGVGRPVVDLFRRGGLRLTGVTITAGKEETHDPANYKDWHVAKLLLVSRLQAALNTGELRIAKALPEVPALLEELDNFRGVFNDTGYARFGAREGKHDDLVLAVALGIWRAYSKPAPDWIGTYLI